MLQLCILTCTESGNTVTIIVAETQNLRKPPIFLVLKMNMSKTTSAIAFCRKRKITEAFCQLNPFQPSLSVEHTS
jgi:hypothetical protein